MKSPMYTPVICIFLFAYTIGFSQNTREESLLMYKECIKKLETIETGFLMSCPFSKGADAVVSFLRNLPGFVRDSSLDDFPHPRNWPSRYIAKNATINHCRLIDKESHIELQTFEESDYFSFSTVYYFENKKDNEKQFDELVELLDNQLKIRHELRFNLFNEPYLEYFFACGKLHLSQSLEIVKNGYYMAMHWEPSGPSPPFDIPSSRLCDSRDTISIGLDQYYLQAHMNRDFMPMCPPNGRPMNTTVCLKSVLPSTSLRTLLVDAIWVVHEDGSVYKDWLMEEKDSKPNSKSKTLRAGKGPYWKPGSKAVAVVRITDKNGKEYLLKASEKVISQSQ